MRIPCILFAFLLLCPSASHAQQRDAGHGFRTLQLSGDYTSEGVNCADFDRDGDLDVVAGFCWYEGPEFAARHQIAPPKKFDPHGYSNVVQPCFCGDYNADGFPDVFYVVRLGTWQTEWHWHGFWYENPAGADRHWQRHKAIDDITNESPMWTDLNANGHGELLSTSPEYGYATYDPVRPGEEWIFSSVESGKQKSEMNWKGGPRHGMGFGDIDGDGRLDVLSSAGWWKQPADGERWTAWQAHPYKFAAAAAQMHVYDVDGDGLNDVATVWHCHRYGLLWYEQTRDEEGNTAWQKHEILTCEPDPDSDALRISQMHALAAADLNGDGLKDLITGKRWWAHGPRGDVDPGQPAVLYWFELRRRGEGEVEFIPHLIHDDSGVGTQVTIADVDADGRPDVLTSNKKGTYVHFNRLK